MNIKRNCKPRNRHVGDPREPRPGGRDRNGMTALLKSVTRVSPQNGGFITNLKLGSNLFGPQRATLTALLDAYWKLGGGQLNLTVVDPRDLENAMLRPESFGHILVRIGGWSARFVDLDATTQQEILRRTLYT